MRSTPRLFLAAVALISAAAFVRAQDSAAPAPAPAPSSPVVAPLPEFPMITMADTKATGPELVLTIDRSALTVEPAAPPAPAKTESSAAEKPRLVVTDEQKTAKAPKSSVEVSTSFDPAAAAASLATVGLATNPALPNAAANVAPAASVGTEFPNQTGTGRWVLLGLVVVALFTSITRYRSRLPKGYPITAIANLPPAAEPVPVAVPVPAPLN